MWSKFLRNLASFDSVDKMGLSRLSDSCKIHHICSKDSSKFTNKAHTSSSVRHIEFFCGVQACPCTSSFPESLVFPVARSLFPWRKEPLENKSFQTTSKQLCQCWFLIEQKNPLSNRRTLTFESLFCRLV